MPRTYDFARDSSPAAAALRQAEECCNQYLRLLDEAAELPWWRWRKAKRLRDAAMKWRDDGFWWLERSEKLDGETVD